MADETMDYFSDNDNDFNHVLQSVTLPVLWKANLSENGRSSLSVIERKLIAVENRKELLEFSPEVTALMTDINSIEALKNEDTCKPVVSKTSINSTHLSVSPIADILGDGVDNVKKSVDCSYVGSNFGFKSPVSFLNSVSLYQLRKPTHSIVEEAFSPWNLSYGIPNFNKNVTTTSIVTLLQWSVDNPTYKQLRETSDADNDVEAVKSSRKRTHDDAVDPVLANEECNEISFKKYRILDRMKRNYDSSLKYADTTDTLKTIKCLVDEEKHFNETLQTQIISNMQNESK